MGYYYYYYVFNEGILIDNMMQEFDDQYIMPHENNLQVDEAIMNLSIIITLTF